jgi:GNAT superfamily N-acetyltransferase
MSKLEIKAASETDVPQILGFIEQLADYEKLRDRCVATESALRQYLFGDTRYAEVIIAYWENRPVGFALFFHNFSTFLALPGVYLEDLFVIPEMRGRGIGRALLARLAAIAGERGCGRLEWSVLDWNEPAIRFYKSLGAVAMDEWATFRVTGEALSRLAGNDEC